MSKTSKGKSQTTRKGHSNGKTIERTNRKTYAITQRGVTSSSDLTAFHAAALSDIDAGRADLKEMTLMRAITGQIIAHENLKLKAGAYKNRTKQHFLEG